MLRNFQGKVYEYLEPGFGDGRMGGPLGVTVNGEVCGKPDLPDAPLVFEPASPANGANGANGNALGNGNGHAEQVVGKSRWVNRGAPAHARVIPPKKTE